MHLPRPHPWPDAWLLLWAAPALALWWALLRYGVGIIFSDALAFVEPTLALWDGSLPASGLLVQVYNHRPIVPFFIVSTLTLLSKWQPAAELALAPGAGAASVILAARLAVRTLPGRPLLSRLLLLVIAVSVFSLAQVTTWLQSPLFAITLLMTLFLAAVWMLSAPPPGWGPLLAAALFCLAATFTLNQGLLTWPALLPLITYRWRQHQQRQAAIIAWLLAFGAAAAAYYVAGYDSALDVYTPAAADFWQRIAYGLVFLGAPVAGGYAPVAFGFGVVLVLSGSALAVACLRNPKTRSAALVWATVGLFTFALAAATAAGRSGLGINHALQPRFITMSLWATVAAAALLCLSGPVLLIRRRVIAACLAAIIGALATSSLTALPEWQDMHTSLVQKRECLMDWGHANEQCLSGLGNRYFNADDVRRLAEQLENAGVLQRMR